jgi:hypothetical protein
VGAALLERYFEWAPQIDRFTPIQVATQFDVSVPDPADPDSGQVTPDRRGIQYRVKIDLAVIDENELYRLDEQALTRSWAWQLSFLSKLEGTIHNELRATSPDPAQPSEIAARAIPGPGGIITQRSTGSFRRTHTPRTGLEIERCGVAVAHELQEMTDPSLPIYPESTPARRYSVTRTRCSARTRRTTLSRCCTQPTITFGPHAIWKSSTSNASPAKLPQRAATTLCCLPTWSCMLREYDCHPHVHPGGGWGESPGGRACSHDNPRPGLAGACAGARHRASPAATIGQKL